MSDTTATVDETKTDIAATTDTKTTDAAATDTTKTVDTAAAKTLLTETPAVVPAEYKLELPKESLLKPEDLETVKAFAKANKLTQAQAEAVLTDRNTVSKGFAESQQKQSDAAKKAWLDETLKDPEFADGKLQVAAEGAKRFIAKYGNQEINKFLDETGLGNNSHVLKMFYKAFKETMAEDTLVKGSPTSKAERLSNAEVFLGESAKA